MGLAEVVDIMDIADILQIYYRHIAADYHRLRWKTADCGGRCHKVCPIIVPPFQTQVSARQGHGSSR